MIPLEKLNSRFRIPRLTIARMVLALVVAVVADGLQFFLTWLPFADQIIDVIAMFLTAWLIGFHWLLLPTFVTELVPIVDDLPTWTGCTVAVIILRRREQRAAKPPVLTLKSD